jgi:hypothetical protein
VPHAHTNASNAGLERFRADVKKRSFHAFARTRRRRQRPDLLPDLRSGALEVRARVGQVLELVAKQTAAVRFFRFFRLFRLFRRAAFAAFAAFAESRPARAPPRDVHEVVFVRDGDRAHRLHARAERAHQLRLLRRGVVGKGQKRLAPQRVGHHRHGHARGPGGALGDDAAATQGPVRHRLANDFQRDPVLDRAPGVGELALDKHVAPGRVAERRDADHGRVADGVQHGERHGRRRVSFFSGPIRAARSRDEPRKRERDVARLARAGVPRDQRAARERADQRRGCVREEEKTEVVSGSDAATRRRDDFPNARPGVGRRRR